MWCILRYSHQVKEHPNRIKDLKQYENDLNFKGIEFPVKLKDIKKFENNNPNLPGINVFSINEYNKIYPLRMNEKDCNNSIDLFFYTNEDGNKHYSFIKDFSRLISSQVSKDTNKKYYCKKCLSHFTNEELLNKHISYCKNNETVAVKMPPKNSFIGFKNNHKKLPLPFVAYADFECFTKPMNNCEPNPDNSFTMQYQKHEPCGFCLYIKPMDGINIKIEPNPLIYTKKNICRKIRKDNKKDLHKFL